MGKAGSSLRQADRVLRAPVVRTKPSTVGVLASFGSHPRVAIGTALNLPYYAKDVRLTGLDISPEMLTVARRRAAEARRDIDLREGDAHSLPFEEGSFDAVVCTYSLCNIPDPLLAVNEMKRVLKPGGRLILVDHIRAAMKPVFWLQKGIEFFSARLEGEHATRRPLEQVKSAGLEVVERQRLAPAGVVERLVALKPEGEVLRHNI